MSVFQLTVTSLPFTTSFELPFPVPSNIYDPVKIKSFKRVDHGPFINITGSSDKLGVSMCNWVLASELEGNNDTTI